MKASNMTTSQSKSLSKLIYPFSVAIIGASANKKKIGYEIYKNIKKFKGHIYLVNSKGGNIGGNKIYSSIISIKDEIDLAIIAIPATYVIDVIEECGKKGVKAAVIITAGFSETGNESTEQELLAVAKQYGVRIVGPNSVGIANNDITMNGTFIMDSKKGHISFISQSGALGAAIVYKTIYENIGFSKFISLGNMVDINFCDMVEYLATDNDTKSIALYIEGIKNGKRFIKIAKRCSLKKPIIALKSGKSNSGSRAAASHTGSMAGDDDIYEAAFRQAGILRADTIDDLIDWANVFSLNKTTGNRVAILTNAGGPGILAADECEKQGLIVAKLSKETSEKLKKILPPYASTNNPIDTIAQAGYEEYIKSLKILQEDTMIDAILAVVVVPNFTNIGMTVHARALVDGWDKEKTLITCFMSGEIATASMRYMAANDIPCYPSPERAAKALGALWSYSRWYNEHKNKDTDIPNRN